MAKSTKFRIDGMEEFMDLLEGLPNTLKDRTLRDINRKVATKNIAAPLKAAHSGFRKGIAVGAHKRIKSAVLVGATTDAFVMRFLEYGTIRRETRDAYNRGILTGKRTSVRPIMDSGTPKVIADLEDNYQLLGHRFLKRAVDKMNRKARRQKL